MEGLTKYEQARVIGARALQISMGAPLAITLTDKELQSINYNPIEIAKLEFNLGLIQIAVRTTVPGLKKKEPIKYFDQSKLE